LDIMHTRNMIPLTSLALSKFSSIIKPLKIS
jgi:hypothetical protein